MPHPLSVLLENVANERFPNADGVAELMPKPLEYAAALIGVTGHIVVAADIDRHEATRRLPVGDFAAYMAPGFLQWVAEQTGSVSGVLDAVFVATCAPGTPDPELQLVDDLAHSRVDRASRYRRDLRVYTTADEAGVLVLGRGLNGRWELAFEVDESARGRGLGRSLCAAATMLLPPGTPVWAQVSPGNAASMRAVAAAGFRIVASEMLFHTEPDR